MLITTGRSGNVASVPFGQGDLDKAGWQIDDIDIINNYLINDLFILDGSTADPLPLQ